jgi:hypothetical protein
MIASAPHLQQDPMNCGQARRPHSLNHVVAYPEHLPHRALAKQEKYRDGTRLMIGEADS